MSVKGVIFDLDGVIVDTAKYHYIAWKDTASKLGYDFTEEDNEKLKGVSRVQSLEMILELAGKEISQDEKDELLKEKNEDYLKLISKMNKSEILPGIEVFLTYLKEQKIPFSLGSASKNAKLILNTLNLVDSFDAIVDGNDVSKAKPNPEVFLVAANKLGLNPDECMVVEDAIAGVEAANSAKMLSVGIGDATTLGHADYVLDNTALLTPDFFEKIKR